MTDHPPRGYALADVLPILQRIAANEIVDGWYWGRNFACKYVTLAIDTRDGGYVRLTDRDGNPISPAELARQAGRIGA